MILKKENNQIDLNNPAHISAYKNAGWEEVEETRQPEPTEEPRRRKPKEEQPAE